MEELLERSELRGVGRRLGRGEEELEPRARQLKIVNRNLIGGCLNPLLWLDEGCWEWGGVGKSECGKAFKNNKLKK